MMRREGFTLIEVVVAMAIFAVISMMAYPTLLTLLNNGAAVEQRTARLAELQKALTIMERDVSQMLNRDVRDNYGSELKALVGASNSIEFSRLGWRNPAGWNRSNIQRVGYAVMDDMLIRQAWWAVDRSVDTEVAAAPMLGEVTGLTIRFLAEGEWQDYWPPLSTSAEPPVLPKAIEITVELKDLGNITRLLRVAG